MGKTTLQETVQRAEFATNVEVIDVPVQGDHLSLLRTRELPEFAFVMWTIQNPGAHCQMAFRLPNEGRSDWYPVLCACCPSERHGLKPPNDCTQPERKAWERDLAKSFKTEVLNACQAHGVITLFVRRAPWWQIRYGHPGNIAVLEAEHHQRAMSKLYDIDIVHRALRFIDYGASRGFQEFTPPILTAES